MLHNFGTHGCLGRAPSTRRGDIFWHKQTKDTVRLVIQNISDNKVWKDQGISLAGCLSAVSPCWVHWAPGIALGSVPGVCQLTFSHISQFLCLATEMVGAARPQRAGRASRLASSTRRRWRVSRETGTQWVQGDRWQAHGAACDWSHNLYSVTRALYDQ